MTKSSVSGSSSLPIQSIDQAQFRNVMGHFSTGVTVVTAIDLGAPVGFTCQSFTSISLDPPLVAVVPAKSSTSWPRIARVGVFAVNILSDSQETTCRSFARSGGDKFVGVKWRAGKSGAPILEGSLASAECEIWRIHDAGDHDLVTARVISVEAHPGRPLLYYRSQFARLGA